MQRQMAVKQEPLKQTDAHAATRVVTSDPYQQSKRNNQNSPSQSERVLQITFYVISGGPDSTKVSARIKSEGVYAKILFNSCAYSGGLHCTQGAIDTQ